MDIFSVFNLLGGVALFLFGMQIMSSGLTKLSGGKLEKTLRKMTSNSFKSIALGAGITIAIQSSSALTVMLVGLVNSGIMQLEQTIGVIMGSNIGTTLTAWILSLSGIDSDVFFIRLLNPNAFAPLVALIGALMIMLAKSGRKRDVGNIMMGFAMLIFGMSMMSGAVSPLADIPEFASILTMFSNPVLGVLVGAVFTGIIQSSAASVGILQALSATGTLTYGAAIPIIMGQNIGTCVTALLSSIGANKNAKRVSIVHISFNIIGTIVLLILFYGIHAIYPLALMDIPIGPAGIALVHSIFNITSTFMLLPFAKQLEKLARFTIRDKKDVKDSIELLDERLLLNPTIAIQRCREVTHAMARMAHEGIIMALEMVENNAFNEKTATQIQEIENTVDLYEDKLGSYLIKIETESLDVKSSQEVSMLLQNIGDFERISDHALNIMQSAQEMDDKQIAFSGTAREEIRVLAAAIREILDIACTCFEQEDTALATRVEPLEDVIDELRANMRNHHIIRLREGTCTLEMGFVFLDLLTNLERVADHCSNIAVCIIAVSEGLFDTHQYTTRLKGSDAFKDMFEEYRTKYTLAPMPGDVLGTQLRIEQAETQV